MHKRDLDLLRKQEIHSALTSLTLSGCAFQGEHSADTLFETIGEHQTLLEVKLVGTKVGASRAISAIADAALRNQSLRSLKLVDTNISPDAVAVIAKVLVPTHGSKLKSLDLLSNGIGEKGNFNKDSKNIIYCVVLKSYLKLYINLCTPGFLIVILNKFVSLNFCLLHAGSSP